MAEKTRKTLGWAAKFWSDFKGRGSHVSIALTELITRSITVSFLNKCTAVNFKHNSSTSCIIRSAVGIAIRYGLDVPGFQSNWGRDFPRPSRPVPRLTKPPVQRVLCLFSGVKRSGCGVEHPPQTSVAIKERVELYLSPPPPAPSLHGLLQDAD